MPTFGRHRYIALLIVMLRCLANGGVHTASHASGVSPSCDFCSGHGNPCAGAAVSDEQTFAVPARPAATSLRPTAQMAARRLCDSCGLRFAATCSRDNRHSWRLVDVESIHLGNNPPAETSGAEARSKHVRESNAGGMR